MSKSWQEWTQENIQRNCDAEGILRILLDNKFTPDAIREMMGDKFPAHSQLLAPAAVPPAMAVAGTVDPEQIRRKRESVVQIQRMLASLNPKTKTIERREGLSPAEFLEEYYSTNRPVILCGMMKNWKAAAKWTPEYLKSVCGGEMVEIMASRETNPLYEIDEAPHRKNVKFSEFIDMVTGGNRETNDYYLTARNEFFRRPGVKPLLEDFEIFPEYLNQDAGNGVFLWFGPPGTVTPLHHDMMNIFLAQVQGRKLIKLVSPNELDLVYNHHGVYSLLDLTNPDYSRFPDFRQATVIEFELNAGEVLFLPVGWWHYVKGLERSISISFNNFILPNQYEWNNPQGHGGY